MPILNEPCSSSLSTCATLRGSARDRVELRVEIREELVRLEPALDLERHHLERLLLHQRDRVELRIEHARDRVGLRERLADEREARRQCDVVLQRDALKIGERLAGADPGERTPVEARQLAPHVVHEPRLVRAQAGERQAQDQVGDVVGAVLRDREQQQREPAARVVVEPAEQAEVEQREPAVGRQEDVPACGSAW